MSTAGIRREKYKAVEKAKKIGIDLSEDDIIVLDGDLYIDGMDPEEWIHAMSMD